MQYHYASYFAEHTHPESLLIMDNFSAHFADEVVKIFDEKKIKYLPLAANTTLCQGWNK